MRHHSPLNWHRTTRRRRGFSIIELLVSIIIIGILVAVLVPIIASRTEQARQARVQADLQNLGEQEERVGVDTGYYIRLFALNDVMQGDGVAYNRGTNLDRADGLTDYALAQPFYQLPGTNGLFIDTKTGFFAAVDRQDFITRMQAAESKYDGSVAWNGPYINWQKDNNLYNSSIAPDGTPDDPWGNNYLLFTRQGMIREPQGDIVTATAPVSGGGWGSGGGFKCDIFDRPMVVSVGPNGLPGNGVVGSPDGEFGKGDDYIRAFGR